MQTLSMSQVELLGGWFAGTVDYDDEAIVELLSSLPDETNDHLLDCWFLRSR